MDLRIAVHMFVTEGRELLEKLRSNEGDSLTSADLRILKVQLYLLDHQVTCMEKKPRPERHRIDHR